MRGFQGPTSVEIVKNVKFWRGDKIVCPSVWGPVTCVRGDAPSNREFAGHSTGQSLDGLHPDPPTHHHFHTHPPLCTLPYTVHLYPYRSSGFRNPFSLTTASQVAHKDTRNNYSHNYTFCQDDEDGNGGA